MAVQALQNHIITDRLAIGYGHTPVAQHLSVDIGGGMLTCLIGRNGLGKSTLLRTLAGLQPPLAGRVTLTAGGATTDVAKASRQTLSRLVGIVLTERPDVQNLTVSDVVALGRMPYTGFFGRLSAADRSAVSEALRLTGMSAFAHRDISMLSDGEMQKVMIARALAQQTPFILLDEPAAFLDYPGKRDALRLLARLAHESGKAILASTHDLDLALRLADRIITITPTGFSDVSKEQLRDIIGQE